MSTSWALAGPGQSSFAVVKKAQSDDGIPRMFNDFPEQQAICAFFLDFVLLPRNKDSVQGHLEHLLPLYKTTTPDSPLSLATSSVALALSGKSSTKQQNRQLGQTVFGRALRKTSAAIKHPVDSRKDETLMAVLLLGLFEVCLGSFVCPLPAKSLKALPAMVLLESRSELPESCTRVCYMDVYFHRVLLVLSDIPSLNPRLKRRCD